jgi:quercetin dioxygenase-like cupin family protein
VGHRGMGGGRGALSAGLVAVGLAGALAGCGSSGGATSSRTATPATAAGSPTAASGVVRTQLAQGTMADPLHIVTTSPSQLTVQSVTIAPGAVVPWHIHPGAESTVVVAGQVLLTVASAPCAPRRLGPGEAFDIPAGMPHTARNEGDLPARLIVTYLGTPPGVPLARPVAGPASCPA